ncbi:hypothetical protein ACQLN5_004722 [Escherichia coli]
MKVQDREVVKNLLQYLTSKNLTSSVEFREALKHFNVTTVYRWENKHSADVFCEVVCAAGDDE